ncbi:MAG: hypothetical protein ACE5G3_03065, partial [Gammaproteobacteria bacterium]
MLDFRSFIQLLEDRGEVDHISREVERTRELAGIMSKIDMRRRAFRFARVSGSSFPVVGGLYNSLERFGLALGHAGPEGFGHAQFDARIEAAKAESIAPVTVASGPCQENVVSGGDVDLSDLPVPTFFELDSG